MSFEQMAGEVLIDHFQTSNLGWVLYFPFQMPRGALFSNSNNVSGHVYFKIFSNEEYLTVLQYISYSNMWSSM